MIRYIGKVVGWIAGGIGYIIAAFYDGFMEGVTQFFKKDLTKKAH